MSDLREPTARISNDLAELARPAADRRVLDGIRIAFAEWIDQIRDRVRSHPLDRVNVGDDDSGSRRKRIAVFVGVSVVSALTGAFAVWKLSDGPGPQARTLRIPTARSAIGPSVASVAPTPTLALGVLPIITVPPPSSTTTTISVTVHAAGAVRSPGVFVFHEPARIDDVISAAGGLANDADDAGLNLAAPVADGQRIFVPQHGQEIPTVLPVEVAAAAEPVTVGNVGAAGNGAAKSAGGKSGGGAMVNLNTATAEELDSLPGVGPATAAAILAYRSEKGRFRSISELMEVRGIGEAKFAAMRARVAV
jgi:comEA protein